MARVEKIHELLSEINRDGLEVAGGFYFLSARDMAKIYNGCGPDWLDEKVRDLLTDYYEFFEADFLEHDISFHFTDGTREGFTAANKRLYRNCKRTVNAKLSWWKEPKEKAYRYFQAWYIYRACQRFGFSAYVAS